MGSYGALAGRALVGQQSKAKGREEVTGRGCGHDGAACWVGSGPAHGRQAHCLPENRGWKGRGLLALRRTSLAQETLLTLGLPLGEAEAVRAWGWGGGFRCHSQRPFPGEERQGVGWEVPTGLQGLHLGGRPHGGQGRALAPRVPPSSSGSDPSATFPGGC